VFKLFIANLKMMVRNRQALFWSIAFPVIFIIIFGLFFGQDNTSSGTITIINKSKNEISIGVDKGITESKVFKIAKIDSIDKAMSEIKKGKLSAAVYIPENFGVAGQNTTNKIKIYYDPASVQTSGVLRTITDKILTEASFKIQNVQPLFVTEQELINNNSKNNDFTYFDFVLVGILGLALMNGSIIGIAVSISKYREDKILKRIISTPLKTWKFVLAEVTSRLVLNLVQIGLILSIGIYGFNGHINGSIFVVILLSLLGGILFQLVGFTIASFAKTTDAAEGMAQAISIPMMFLAGIFFPIDSLPTWLSNIVQYLPLAPLLRMMRTVAIEAGSPFANPANILIVLGWILITLVISLYKFRLTEE